MRCFNALQLLQAVAILVIASFFAQFAKGASSIPETPQPHKIQISDAALAKRIEAQGGRLIGDYGGYRLYEVAQLTSDILANTRTQVRDEYDVVHPECGAT